MKQELEKAISMAISTGKVKIGYSATIKSVLSGKVKATLISNNIPLDSKKILLRNCELSQIPVIEYEKSGFDLGAVCGRPHIVSTLAILNPGNSKILDFI
ncbi:MAG: 50S ribosomal protein L30e [Candidatus Heimdallarchaeota archaeon]|nr:MAG: 50S ribosomal protein L30e [Candidatus Heimdallarchaeota archaeon]